MFVRSVIRAAAIAAALASIAMGAAAQESSDARKWSTETLLFILGRSFTVDGIVPDVTPEDVSIITGITPEMAEDELVRRERLELAGEDIDTDGQIDLNDIEDVGNDNEIDLDEIEDTGNDNEIDLDQIDTGQSVEGGGDTPRPAEEGTGLSNVSDAALLSAEPFPCNDDRRAPILGFLGTFTPGMASMPAVRATIRPEATGMLRTAEALAADHGLGCQLGDSPSSITVGEAIHRLRLLTQP
jgi:hypothetical protein